MIKETQIQDMADVIVRLVHPRQIILFGSAANGTATDDSDCDFLIVEDEPFSKVRSRRKEAAKIWQALMPFPVAKDVLVYSSEEVTQRDRSRLLTEALATGRVIYER